MEQEQFTPECKNGRVCSATKLKNAIQELLDSKYKPTAIGYNLGFREALISVLTMVDEYTLEDDTEQISVEEPLYSADEMIEFARRMMFEYVLGNKYYLTEPDAVRAKLPSGIYDIPGQTLEEFMTDKASVLADTHVKECGGNINIALSQAVTNMSSSTHGTGDHIYWWKMTNVLQERLDQQKS